MHHRRGVATMDIRHWLLAQSVSIASQLGGEDFVERKCEA
jgi:hypothetical protein